MSHVLVKPLCALAKVPTYASEYAVGADIYANEGAVIPPHGRALIGTGIALEMSLNCWAQIAPRSGAAYLNGIMVMAGIIDPDYRGEIKVLLYNASNQDTYYVNLGDRIAQLIIHWRPGRAEFTLTDTLTNTERADKGFGSTGIH